MRRLLVVLGAVSAITPGAARAAVAIQPGMLILAGQTQCTAGFVFDGADAQAGHTYLATAAHCVQSTGQPVADQDGATIGTVAAFGAAATDQTNDEHDWALVEVSPAAVARVDPALAGHPDLPHGGAADAAHAIVGDKVQFSGQGQPWLTPSLQQQRTGSLLEFAEPHYVVRGPIWFGDSGGPVVDLVSGRALGLVSLTVVEDLTGAPVVYETSGPTPNAIVAQAAAAGIHVALRTVEGGKGALPVPPVTPTRGGRPTGPKVSLTVDYLLARRALRLGGHRLLVSAWLRGRRLELTLKRRGRVISRARKQLRTVPAQAGLAIQVPQGSLSARGVLRYGSKRVRFRVSAHRIAFVLTRRRRLHP
jgi:hypothetical protein